MWRCSVLTVLRWFRAGARVSLYLAWIRTRFGDAGRISAGRAAAAEGPRSGPEARGAPGAAPRSDPAAHGTPLRPRSGASQPSRVEVNSEPGAAVPQSGPREDGKVGAGTSPPLSPRFPRAVNRLGAAPGEVSPGVRGWGLPSSSPRQKRSAAPRLSSATGGWSGAAHAD